MTLEAAHVTRTRRVHQVTLAALYILKQHAYDHYHLECGREGLNPLKFQEWCIEGEKACPLFHYRATVMELELCLLIFVRQASFIMYLDALAELAPWFHALSHTNYACWLPVHLRDMVELPTKHPGIAKESSNGSATVKKNY